MRITVLFHKTMLLILVEPYVIVMPIIVLSYSIKGVLLTVTFIPAALMNIADSSILA